MSLYKLLSGRKKDILKKWQQEIFQIYPADSIRFLTSESDQFANPVGHSVREHTETLLSGIMSEDEILAEKYTPILDEMIRIRAVQDFSPSRALKYLYDLKKVISGQLDDAETSDNNTYCELVNLYKRIDDVIMIAFDIYSKCREKLFEIKVQTAKNQVSGILRRSDLVAEIPEWQSVENE